MLKPVPHTGTLETLIFELLSLVSVIVLLRLVPTFTVPKFSEVGLTLSSVAPALPEAIGRTTRTVKTRNLYTDFGQRPELRGSWLMVFFFYLQRMDFLLL